MIESLQIRQRKDMSPAWLTTPAIADLAAGVCLMYLTAMLVKI